MDFLNTAFLWITLFIMLVGLFSLLVPVVPGLWIMWLAGLGYGFGRGFDTLGIIVMVIITLLTVAGSLIDNLFMGAGARKGGASWLTILVALLAGVLGTIFFPPFGGFVAAPAAILLLEYLRLHDWKKAFQALRGLATGWGAAVAARFLIGIVVLGLWVLWVWQGQG
jgi:uncharacterized protein YqgC (DUF456 family)